MNACATCVRWRGVESSSLVEAFAASTTCGCAGRGRRTTCEPMREGGAQLKDASDPTRQTVCAVRIGRRRVARPLNQRPACASSVGALCRPVAVGVAPLRSARGTARTVPLSLLAQRRSLPERATSRTGTGSRSKKSSAWPRLVVRSAGRLSGLVDTTGHTSTTATQRDESAVSFVRSATPASASSRTTRSSWRRQRPTSAHDDRAVA